MFRNQMRQLCSKCKGSGTHPTKVATDRDGNTMIADPYVKGEAPRPVMENCKTCEGTGFEMRAAPTTIMQEGEKVVLSEDERRMRFNDSPAFG